MNITTVYIIATELTISLNFTDDLEALSNLAELQNNIIWCNGGNSRVIEIGQVKELLRTATLFTQLLDEADVKKGPPPQHRIYWDDCPEGQPDFTKLIKE